MLDAIKPLLESGLINEETGVAINEAWESKLNEAKEQVRAELREEFAQRYEHDRSVMVEALDKMVTESLSEEIEELEASGFIDNVCLNDMFQAESDSISSYYQQYFVNKTNE